jgi:hypothetical protein
VIGFTFCFNPRERVSGTHWIGGWVGKRAILDEVSKRKILLLHRLQLLSSGPQPLTLLTKISQLIYHHNYSIIIDIIEIKYVQNKRLASISV